MSEYKRTIAIDREKLESLLLSMKPMGREADLEKLVALILDLLDGKSSPEALQQKALSLDKDKLEAPADMANPVFKFFATMACNLACPNPGQICCIIKVDDDPTQVCMPSPCPEPPLR